MVSRTAEGEFELSGRRALVCGASSGIGRATALLLARRGARVTALARTEERLRALVDEIAGSGGAEPTYLVVDGEDGGALTAAVSGSIEDKGPFSLLLNNTGGPPSGRLLEAAPEDLEKAFLRHVLAAHRLVKLLLPGMRDGKYGRIVNVLSTSVREPIPGLGVSNTIRAAMAGWSKTLSGELPPGVTINNVLPGYTRTDRLGELSKAVAARRAVDPEEVYEDWRGTIPEGRLARPEEIAQVIAFLMSPAASYVRGQSIAADGGRLRSI